MSILGAPALTGLKNFEGSGPIVSLPDGAGNPLKSLIAHIEPMQDLHGYDNPWPAGGGKNKALISNDTIAKPTWYPGNWLGVTVNNKNGITQTRGYVQSGAGGFSVKGIEPGTYVLSLTLTISTTTCMLFVSYTTGTDSTTLVNNAVMTKSGTRYSYQFQIPDGATEIAIRPTMHSATESYDFEDIQLELGSVATSFAPYSNICPISGWTVVNVFDEAQYDAGATPKLSVSFPSEAGTVYGGTLDMTTGVLTVDRAMVNLGLFAWRKTTTGGRTYFSCNPGNMLDAENRTLNIVCSSYVSVIGGISYADVPDKSVYNALVINTPRICIIDTAYDSSTEGQFATAMSGVQAVYPLATPITYQLTPQQINTLIGENNIWADTGNVDVEYSKRSFSFLSSMISSHAKHYTVRWDKEHSQMVRLNDAKNITTDTANFKHSGSVNPNYDNPFDSIYPWSGRKLCNISLNDYLALQSGDNIKDCVTYWENQTGFSYDDTDGVWVYTPEFWGKSWDDGTYRYFDVADQPVNGYRHYPEMITARWRGVRESRTIGGTAKNIILSKPGLPITNTVLSTIHTYAKNGGMTLDSVYTLDASLLLYLVEYANYNAQSAIGNGVSELYDQTTLHPDAAVTAGTTVQFTGLTSGQLADFIEGAIVDFGTASGGAQTAKTYITAVETTSGVTTVTLADAVTITTDTFVSIHGRINYADADIGSMSGYIGTNSKSDAYYRGEALWGNMFNYTLGAYKSTTDHVWLAAEGTEDNYDAINTSVHTDTGIVLTGSAGYIKTLAWPDSLGTLFACSLCTATPGTATAPVGDYFNTSSGNNRVLLVGGIARDGLIDGPFYWGWGSPADSSYWGSSGRPLLKNP